MFESRETAAVAEAALAGQELSRGKNAEHSEKPKKHFLIFFYVVTTTLPLTIYYLDKLKIFVLF